MSANGTNGNGTNGNGTNGGAGDARAVGVNDNARPAGAGGAALRVLFVANDIIPTLQLSFIKPLRPEVAAGRIATSFLTGKEIDESIGKNRPRAEGARWVRRRLDAERPDLIVCCRYSGPQTDAMCEHAAEHGIPLVFHVDDDLLNIPPEIGQRKYEMHNNPRRLAAVRTLLERSDLVYCSTPALEERLRALGFHGAMVHGRIYCASRVRRRPEPGPVRRIGYMGFDHAHDFEIALPAVERVLTRHPGIAFELFGSIPMPESFARFGERARVVEPVRDYARFLQALADRRWDIGIAPLARTPFNAVKANTKWVEYTASGMAVVASAGLVYDDCMRDGRGLLVDDHEWGDALEMLVARPDLRQGMAEAAQRRLLTEYSESELRRQVLRVFDAAWGIAAMRREGRPLARHLRRA